MKNKRLIDYLIYNKCLFFGIVLLILFASALAQATPYFQGLIVDNAILSANVKSFISLTFIFVVILLLDSFARGYLSIILNNLSHSVSRNIRKDTFGGLLRQPLNFFEANNAGYLIQSSNSFLYYLGQTLSSGINNLAIGTSRFLIVYVYIFILNFKLALILGALYLGIVFIMALYAKSLHNKNKDVKKAELKRNSLILENLNGIETYLAYDNQKNYMSHYEKTNKNYGNIRTKYYWFYNTLTPLTDLLACLGTVLIYQFAIGDVYNILEVGIIVSVLTYATRVNQPIQMISKGLADIFNAKTTLELVNNLTAHKSTTERQSTPRSLNITCQDLSYENPIHEIKIENLNLTIPFGQKIKIIGKHGVGKTAFSHLLCGIYKPTSGNIFIGKTNITELSPKVISNLISIASDEVGVFNGTIFQNISFANKKASEKKVIEAIKYSGLATFVNKLPQKENTIISENMLSESEKQLIAFARVILKNTPIVIFDEFTRDLNKEMCRKFFKKLDKFSKDKTIIYISQERETNFKFDKVIKFQNKKTKP